MSTRLSYLFAFVIIAGLLVYSLYLQFFQGFVPCPLCTLQRISFLALGLSFFIGFIFAAKKWGRRFANSLSLIFSISGIIFAGRQVWLQHFPPLDASECGVSLEYMIQVLPIHEVAAKIFAGTAECTKHGWDFLGFSMADWSLVWFIAFFVFVLYLIFKKKES